MSQTTLNEDEEHDHLCRVCSKIHFNRYLSEEIKEPFLLGSWDSIQQKRKCPFCRLVVHALKSKSHMSPERPTDEVALSNQLSWKLGIELSPYDRSRSESYSNKYDLRSKAKQYAQTAFRFLVFSTAVRDGEQRAAGTIQYLAHRERNPDHRQLFGRKVKPDHVDVGLLNAWLDGCSKWHEGGCDRDVRTVDSLPLNLRLVDVHRRCVIKMSKGEVPEYVALSYMWGSQKMKEETGMEPAVLLRNNIKFDPSGDELTPLQKRLPKTLEDAIILTRMLGYRYLWNDALCIVQDNPLEEKIPDLINMKLIYSCSSLTIAAAAGAHADYGIPGVGVSRKVHQFSEVVDGLRLATMFPSFTDLENSSSLLWNTRGWTFQEKLLSKRLLLFTDYQVYFKCSESIWTEEVNLETERLSKSVEARRGKYLWDPGREPYVPDERALKLKRYNPQLKIEDEWGYLGGFLDYASAVEEYSKRQLTDPKDTLFAISGILETLEDVTGRFILGLPKKHFLECLLWYPDLGCIQTHNTALDLPSWTWASCNFAQGGITFDMLDVRQLRSLLDATAKMFHVEPDKKKDSSNDSVMGRFSMALSLAGTYGNLVACLKAPKLHQDHTIKRLFHSDGNRMRRIIFDPPMNALAIEDRPNHASMPGALLDIMDLVGDFAKTTTKNWMPTTDNFPYDKHVLAFETVIVRFCIGKPLKPRSSQNHDEVGIFELRNAEGEIIGELVTTYRRAEGDRRNQAFISISCGFSLSNAQIDRRCVPRWRFNGDEKAPQPQQTGNEAKKGKSSIQEARESAIALLAKETGSWTQMTEITSMLHSIQSYVPGRWLPVSDRREDELQNSATALFNDLYSATKGEPVVRALWPVVNVILVDWDGKIARRAGVGKVIMKAWQEQGNRPEEIMFG